MLLSILMLLINQGSGHHATFADTLECVQVFGTPFTECSYAELRRYRSCREERV